MPGLQMFEKILSEKEERIDLARACLMIAEDAYPGLDVERYIGDIERLAIRLRACIPQSGGAEARVVALNQFLYGDLGYWGNTEDYYDPRNSYLNEVLDRRTGIPITLGVVYMELGRRVGLPLEASRSPGTSWCGCGCAAARWCSTRSQAARRRPRTSCAGGWSA